MCIILWLIINLYYYNISKREKNIYSAAKPKKGIYYNLGINGIIAIGYILVIY